MCTMFKLKVKFNIIKIIGFKKENEGSSSCRWFFKTEIKNAIKHSKNTSKYFVQPMYR